MYQSYTGADQQSGAYIFRTDDLPPFELSPSSHADWSVGDFVSDVYQVCFAILNFIIVFVFVFVFVFIFIIIIIVIFIFIFIFIFSW